MLTVTKTQVVDDATETYYKCDVEAVCDGTSLWGDTAMRVVRISNIAVFDEGDYKSIYVTHDSTWDIYTDKGFAIAVSKLLGYKVSFTEQGMQEDGIASMET